MKRIWSRPSRSLGVLISAALVAGAWALPASALAEVPAQPDKSDAKSLPGAAELFEKYIEALGGESSIRSIKSRIIKGTMAAAGQDAQSVQLQTRQIAPDQIVATMTPATGEVIEVGYDGSVGWRRVGKQAPQAVTGGDLRQLKQTADIYQEANYKQRYKEMQTVSLGDFQGKRAYEVRAVDAEGKTSLLYFDPQNSLLIGMRHDQIGPAGTEQVSIALQDYKQFGGVLHPTRIVQSAGGNEVVISYNDIRVNPADVGVISAPSEVIPKK